MTEKLNRWLTAVIVLVMSLQSASAQEWSRFRGPNGTGENETTLIPGTWTEDDYNWQVKLPGLGHSSPILWGEKLFVLSGDPVNATRYVLCFDSATGQRKWIKEFNSAPHHLHTQSSYASSTPSADEERIYVAWAEPKRTTLMALTHNGDVVWEKDLGPWFSQHGFGTSPIIVDGMVILSNSQEAKNGPDAAPDPESFMMAFDRVTGEERWRTPMKSINTSYSVPVLFQPKDKPKQLISISTGEGMFALDPKTGKELWSNPLFDKRTVGSPLVKQDMIFGSTGSGGGGNYLMATHCDGTETKVAYKVTAQAPYVPTAVARDNLLFLIADGGVASCLDLTTGKVHWRERLGGNFSSSPVRAHDKIFCVSMDGEVVVLAAEKEFSLLHRISLDEGCRATPAIANGRLYLRSFSQLKAIGNKTVASTRQ